MYKNTHSITFSPLFEDISYSLSVVCWMEETKYQFFPIPDLLSWVHNRKPELHFYIY